MGSLKGSRHFIGNPISVRALSMLEDRPFPVSVQDMVEGNQFRAFNGTIATGDVSCDWSLALWRNGFWSLDGVFHDDGTLGGDFFFLDVHLGAESEVAARLEGSILNPVGHRTLTVSKDGSDRRVRDHWIALETNGPTARLHAAPAVGVIAAKAAGITVLAAVATVVVVVGGAVVANAKIRTSRCADQSAFDTDAQGRRNPCVSFSVQQDSQ